MTWAKSKPCNEFKFFKVMSFLAYVPVLYPWKHQKAYGSVVFYEVCHKQSLEFVRQI